MRGGPVRTITDIPVRLTGLLERADRAPWGPQAEVSGAKLTARVMSLVGLGREERVLAEAIDQAPSNTARSVSTVARGAGRSPPALKTKDHGDLALQLASAITHHVDVKYPVRRTELVADFQIMLQRADRPTGLSAADVERRARDIARDRIASRLERVLLDQIQDSPVGIHVVPCR